MLPTRTIITRLAAHPARTSLRSITTTPSLLTKGPSTKTPDPSGKPSPTQGHTTTKSHRLDVQNDNAKAGQMERSDAGTQSGGGSQPIDAARMGGGEAKSGGQTEGTGAFKDQVGGQESGAGAGGDVKKGGKTEVPSGGWTGKVSKALGGNKAFHTSSRSLAPTSDSAPAGSREPVEKDLQGEQNQHLKHKSPGQSDSGKGNAADEPHLPSNQQKNGRSGSDATNPAQSGKASGSPKGFASYHSSAVSFGKKERDGAGYASTHESEEKAAGYDTPPTALPPNLGSAYNKSEATPPPKPNMTPSSEAEYSSSAVDPPNPALKKQVKQSGSEGDLDLSRNPQPTGEGGKQGLGEAWKNRKIG